MSRALSQGKMPKMSSPQEQHLFNELYKMKGEMERLEARCERHEARSDGLQAQLQEALALLQQLQQQLQVYTDDLPNRLNAVIDEVNEDVGVTKGEVKEDLNRFKQRLEAEAAETRMALAFFTEHVRDHPDQVRRAQGPVVTWP
jgi:chromosome segregation ATPase